MSARLWRAGRLPRCLLLLLGRLPRCLLLLLGMILVMPPGPATAQAQGSPASSQTQVAGLVIDTGDQEPLFVLVSFTDPDMNAIDLLRATDLPLVTVEFGGLGEGVCEIVDTGCDVGPCRRRLCQTGDPESPFWQLWQQHGPGDWSSSVLGGNQTRIENGDIVAWAWTGVEPSLPSVDMAGIASRVGAPDEITEPGAWSNANPDSSIGDSPSATNILLSATVMILVAAAGIVLTRVRRGHDRTAS